MSKPTIHCFLWMREKVVVGCPHIVRHSPTGMSWGYDGSGPADLALSVLTFYFGKHTAEKHYMQFKREVIALIPGLGREIRYEDVKKWLENQDDTK